LLELRAQGGRLFFLGIGGSSANCSHAVNDFRKICGIEAYTPTDNVSELTARTNDSGWESVFVDWLKGSKLSSRDGVLVLSVGGGNSEKNISVNLMRALDYAKEMGAKTLGIVGRDGGYTAKVADAYVVVPTVNPETITPHTESFQNLILHLIVSHPALKVSEMKWESVQAKERAIFLDRDGVINKVIFSDGRPASPRKLEDFVFTDGIHQATRQLRENGFRIIVVSNQPDLARGKITEGLLDKMTQRIRKEIPIDDVYICPHDDVHQCACRKPKPGMLLQAAQKWNLDLTRSFIVGDTQKDMEAGKAAACKTILLDAPYNQDALCDFRAFSLRDALDIVKSFPAD
jgi:D-sedoheptulose 7-phosphate isomerase